VLKDTDAAERSQVAVANDFDNNTGALGWRIRQSEAETARDRH
jgi:hypothetical protein